MDETTRSDQISTPTTLEHRPASQSVVPKVSDIFPSTAYPTDKQKHVLCSYLPSDVGDHGHSKPVYLLPSRVRKPKASG